MRSHKKALALLLTAGLVMSSFSYLAFAEDEIDDAVAALDAEQAVVQQDEEDEAVEEAVPVEGDAVADDQDVIDETADAEDGEDEDIPDAELADEDANEDEDIPEAAAEDAVDEETEEDVEVEQYAAELSATTDKNILIWHDENEDHPINMVNRVKDLYTAAGATVTIKTRDQLTEADLKGIDVVFIFAIEVSTGSTGGQNIIASAGLLQSFVEDGGNLVLQGENGGYAYNGNRVLMSLGSNMGFNFSISNEASLDNTEFNVDQRPGLAENLNGLFHTCYIGFITTSDPDAVWVARDKNSQVVCMLDKPMGDGSVIVLSDYNYIQIDYNPADVVTQFLCNIANQAHVHTHKFEITASGDTLTAKCVNANCDLDPSSASITIVPPTYEYLGGEGDTNATLTGVSDFETLLGIEVDQSQIFYEGAGNTAYRKSQTAPSDAGQYTATFVYSDNTNEYEISIDYEIEPPRLEFIDSDGQVFVKESDTILTFHATRSLDDELLMDDLDKVLVDNEEVPEDGRDLLVGSVIVKLKPGFLNTLSVGTHTITLTFKDGRSLSTTFTVKEAPKASPQTGEYAGPAVLAVAAVLMAAGAVTCVKTFKKKED